MLLVAHDWGGYIGYLMVLRAPERFDGYLALNMGYPWITPRMLLPHVGALLQYQPLIAFFGVPAQRYTKFLDLAFKVGSALDPETVRVYTDRFRDRVVARTGSLTYRTFLLREIPRAARHPETAKADDCTLEKVHATHFVIEEQADLVRAGLILLAEETRR